MNKLVKEAKALNIPRRNLMLNERFLELFDRKNYKYYKGLVPSRLLSNFIFCFGSNSTRNHGPVTPELAHKHFGAQMGVASGRQGQIYGIVTIALKKGFRDPRKGIRYDEHFLTPDQMKRNFKGLYDYARTHPDLTFLVAYTLHKQGLGPAPNACGYDSFQLARCFGSCDAWGIPLNIVFENYFDRVARKGLHSLKL